MDRQTLEAKCHDCAAYIKFIYEHITFKPENIQVSFTIKDFAHFVIQCDERDDGIIIGRSGATIQAVRLLLHAYSKTNLEGMPCVLEIKDHRQSKFNPLTSRPLYSRHK